MKTNYSFQIRFMGKPTGFLPDGYSKYWKRYLLRYNEALPKDELVYGLEQAKEHLEELRKTKEYKTVPLEIIQSKTKETVVYTDNPETK